MLLCRLILGDLPYLRTYLPYLAYLLCRDVHLISIRSRWTIGHAPSTAEDGVPHLRGEAILDTESIEK